MENEQHNTTETQITTKPEKTINDNTQIPSVQTQPQSTGTIDNSHTNKKRLKMFLIPLVLIVVIIGGYFAFTILTKPSNEEIALDAINQFQQNSNQYQLDVQLGAKGEEYSISYDNSGNIMVVSSGSTILRTDGKTLIKLSGNNDDAINFMKNVLMLGEPDGNNLSNIQNKWVEFGTYLGATPALPNFNAPGDFSLRGTLIVEAEEVEKQNDKPYITAKATMNTNEIYDLLAMIDGKIGYRIFTAKISETDLSKGQVDVNLQLNTNQALEKINTDNFVGQSLSINITKPSTADVSTNLQSVPLPELVDYNFISSTVFNPDFQLAKSKADKERIADIKAMKTAFDIRKLLTGEISSYFGFDQEEFISNNMPGADKELFIDPNDKIIGINGGSYAYSGELDGSNQCGGTFYEIDKGDIEYPSCSTFFIVTTLDTGQQFQLNSGVY